MLYQETSWGGELEGDVEDNEDDCLWLGAERYLMNDGLDARLYSMHRERKKSTIKDIEERQPSH
jgi:hypothetical protein